MHLCHHVQTDHWQHTCYTNEKNNTCNRGECEAVSAHNPPDRYKSHSSNAGGGLALAWLPLIHTNTLTNLQASLLHPKVQKTPCCLYKAQPQQRQPGSPRDQRPGTTASAVKSDAARTHSQLLCICKRRPLARAEWGAAGLPVQVGQLWRWLHDCWLLH